MTAYRTKRSSFFAYLRESFCAVFLEMASSKRTFTLDELVAMVAALNDPALKLGFEVTPELLGPLVALLCGNTKGSVDLVPLKKLTEGATALLLKGNMEGFRVLTEFAKYLNAYEEHQTSAQLAEAEKAKIKTEAQAKVQAKSESFAAKANKSSGKKPSTDFPALTKGPRVSSPSEESEEVSVPQPHGQGTKKYHAVTTSKKSPSGFGPSKARESNSDDEAPSKPIKTTKKQVKPNVPDHLREGSRVNFSKVDKSFEDDERGAEIIELLEKWVVACDDPESDESKEISVSVSKALDRVLQALANPKDRDQPALTSVCVYEPPRSKKDGEVTRIGSCNSQSTSDNPDDFPRVLESVPFNKAWVSTIVKKVIRVINSGKPIPGLLITIGKTGDHTGLPETVHVTVNVTAFVDAFLPSEVGEIFKSRFGKQNGTLSFDLPAKMFTSRVFSTTPSGKKYYCPNFGPGGCDEESLHNNLAYFATFRLVLVLMTLMFTSTNDKTFVVENNHSHTFAMLFKTAFERIRVPEHDSLYKILDELEVFHEGDNLYNFLVNSFGQPADATFETIQAVVFKVISDLLDENNEAIVAVMDVLNQSLVDLYRKLCYVQYIHSLDSCMHVMRATLDCLSKKNWEHPMLVIKCENERVSIAGFHDADFPCPMKASTTDPKPVGAPCELVHTVMFVRFMEEKREAINQQKVQEITETLRNLPKKAPKPKEEIESFGTSSWADEVEAEEAEKNASQEDEEEASEEEEGSLQDDDDFAAAAASI